MKNTLYISLFLLLVANYYGQVGFNITCSDTITGLRSSAFTLSQRNPVASSIKLFLNNSLIENEKYFFNSQFGRIELDNDIHINENDIILVFYKIYPNLYSNTYKKREINYFYHEPGVDSISIEKKIILNPFSEKQIFGDKILKSGSITRGFTVGTTKDFTLNSGLRLQLSGQLSENIDITASLTDENTPIQPEGNTETLDELDKVFIQVKHKNITGVFGDIDYKAGIGEFGKIKRKLKGLQSDIRYGQTEASVVFASTRGKFTSNVLSGSDGVQGPYRLLGENNERNIIIIAGSERVFLDGVELVRGENNDYSIDYSTAELFFTTNKIITSASRITVDFEYSDRQYQRNYFGTNISTKLFDEAIGVKINYLREADDHENPLDLILDENDKQIISQSGDNKYLSVISGATFAQPDSAGIIKGYYTKTDTLYEGNAFTYYKYLPGESTSIYNVAFSYVGIGLGDYQRESLGHYKFVGVGKGGYLPIRFLPLPTIKQLANVVFNSKLSERITLDIEFAGSIYDANRLSSIDDDNNTGFARKISLKYLPGEFNIGNISLGKAGLSINDRFIDGNFHSLDRIDNVEFNRFYNLNTNTIGNEHLTEIELLFNPVNELNTSLTYGRYRRGDSFGSDRFLTTIDLTKDNTYGAKHKFDYVSTTVNELKSKWNRQEGEAYYFLNKVKVYINYLYENKEEKYSGYDSLLAASLKYVELRPGIQFVSTESFNISTSFNYREEYFPINGELKLASISKSEMLSSTYRDKLFYTNLNMGLLKKEYTDEFKMKGFSNNETVLVKSQSTLTLGKRFIQGALYYEAATEKNSRMEKIFLRVPQGTGNYIYLGDLNENGVAEENEFEPTIYDGDYIITTYPTDELFPVVDLKFNTRWTVDLEDQFKGKDFVNAIMKSISTETSWRVDENSRTKNIADVYFLKLASFLDDSLTIRGSNLFTQDFYLFKNKRDFSLRLRYLQKMYLNNFSNGIERGYQRERSVRVRLGLLKEIINQTEFISTDDNVSGPLYSNRNRSIQKNEISTDFSYRPYQLWEVGFKIRNGVSTDRFPLDPTEISYNGQELRLNYSFLTKGRLRFEFERNEYVVNNLQNYIPFEILNGNVVGKNYLLRIIFDYKIGTNLQTTVNYMGRFHGSGKLINTLKAEARAFF